jgi:hypothetical protein
MAIENGKHHDSPITCFTPSQMWQVSKNHQIFLTEDEAELVIWKLFAQHKPNLTSY